MNGNKKRYGSKYKAKVALESIKGEKTAAELASQYGIHATQITRWKKHMLENLPELFSNKTAIHISTIYTISRKKLW